MSWIIVNSIKLDPYDHFSHWILLVLFEQQREDLLHLAISTLEEKEKQVKYTVDYDHRFNMALAGFQTGSIELLLYLVPDIISVCQDKTSNWNLGTQLELILDDWRPHHGRFSGFAGFKLIWENKLFDISHAWYSFSELPQISEFIKENNIPFDLGDYVSREIDANGDLGIVETVLRNLKVDINTLEVPQIIDEAYYDPEWGIVTEETQENEGGGSKTVRLAKSGTFAGIIKKLLQLGLSLERLSQMLD